MKRVLTTLLLISSFLGFFTQAGAADDRWETLRAINWVENPTNHNRRGKFGELGPYQFRPTTWRMHTTKSFQLATQRDVADEVAVAHYEWIKKSLEAAGVHPSAFNIAMAWNSGVNNVINGRAPAVSYNYAERVVNLVHTFKRSARARALAAAAAVPEVALPALPPMRTVTLDEPNFHLSAMHDAPKFEIVIQTEEPEMLVVKTDREPAAPKPAFVFTTTTTATLNPTFSLLPGFSVN